MSKPKEFLHTFVYNYDKSFEDGYNFGIRKMEEYYRPLLIETQKALRNIRDFIEDATDNYPMSIAAQARLAQGNDLLVNPIIAKADKGNE